MSIYVGTSEIKNVYVGTTPVKEIFVWTTKVRPAGWQPWTNTLAYYPLTAATTVYDQSWNNRTLSKSWTVTFWTYGWVSCAYVNNGELMYQQSNIVSSSTPRTVSWWYYQYQTTSADNATIFWFWESNMWGWGWQIAYWRTRPSSPWLYIYHAIRYWPYTNFSNGVRYHLCYSYDWSGGVLYLNWTSVLTCSPSGRASSSIWISRYSDLSRSIRWYVSEVIFENKGWSASEVLAYYNATKSNYWL